MLDNTYTKIKTSSASLFALLSDSIRCFTVLLILVTLYSTIKLLKTLLLCKDL